MDPDHVDLGVEMQLAHHEDGCDWLSTPHLSQPMWTGLPLLGLALFFLKVPFRIPHIYWRELFVLSLFMAIASVLWPERQVVEL